MIIKKETIANVLFALLLLLDMNFYGLISNNLYSGINNDLNRVGEIIIVICILYIYKQPIRIHFYTKLFFLVMVSIVICSIFSMIKYNESLYDIFVMVNSLLLLMIIWIVEINLHRNGSFVKILYIVMLINMLVVLLQSLLYNKFGIIFVQNITGDISLRNGLLRYSNGAAFIPVISIIITGGFKLVEDNVPKWMRFFIQGLSVYVLIMCVQTRASIISFIVATIITILIKRNKFDRKCVTICAGMVVFILAMQTKQMQFVWNSIFSNDIKYVSDPLSATIRQENIAYRLSFFNKNPIFAMGIVRAIGNLKSVSMGSGLLYYSSDVGIIDTVATYGIFGILIILAIWIHWIKKAWYLFKERLISTNAWYIGLIVYFLLSSITLGYFSPNRIVCFSIVSAILEFGVDLYKEDM